MVLSSTAKASASRIKSGQFNEADVKAILIEMRDKGNPTIREMGDLVAHPERERGIAYDHMVQCYASVAMFASYTSDKARQFPVDGTCDWWLKTYLLGQVDRFDSREIKQKLGTKPFRLIKEIKDYFPPDPYPKTLRRIDTRFLQIVSLLGSLIGAQPAFAYESLRIDVERMLRQINVEPTYALVSDFVVSILTIFHQTQFTLPSGERGTFQINAQSYENLPGFEPRPADFSLLVQNVIPYGDGFVTVLFPVIKVDLEPSDYFADGCVEVDEFGVIKYQTDRPLQFDRRNARPLSVVDGFDFEAIA